MLYFGHLITMAVGPILMIGIINRVKARWAGRKGFPILQLFYDLVRLLRKTSVYSTSSSWVSQLLGVILVSTTLAAALVSPVVPGFSIISFEFDFVFLIYLLGLGRMFLMLGAMDVGSSFEGMGASREASYSVMIEAVWFFTIAALAFASGNTSLSSILQTDPQLGSNGVILVLCMLALFLFIQVESCRVPVDDPNTHLELTMIHEVMVLDQCGVDLALIQYAAALKMTLFAGLIAALVNPYSVTDQPVEAMAASWGIMAVIAVLLGLVESVFARVRLQAIAGYIMAAILVSGVALFLSITGV